MREGTETGAACPDLDPGSTEGTMMNADGTSNGKDLIRARDLDKTYRRGGAQGAVVRQQFAREAVTSDGAGAHLAHAAPRGASTAREGAT
jgi:hypothetical protein